MRRRDPNFTTGHLCRFCGQLVPWGTILRIIRTDPDTPPYMLKETAAHTECLEQLLRPGLALTFSRHWTGRAPMLDDDEDIFLALSPGGIGKAGAQRQQGEGAQPNLRPCAFCALAIAPADLVRLRVQKPVGPVKQPQFDEQSLPVHFLCLAAVSTSRLS
jgi:hypothetical protein